VFDLRPALRESYSGLLHAAGVRNGLILLRADGALRDGLGGPRLERAVGVIYARETERQSHYFGADLANQFDAVIYLDRTRAVTPLR
jgi:erythromycin esterase-like protein